MNSKVSKCLLWYAASQGETRHARKKLTLTPSAPNTPTDKSLLPTPNNFPSPETSKLVTGLLLTVLVFIHLQLSVSHTLTKAFLSLPFCPLPAPPAEDEGLVLTTVYNLFGDLLEEEDDKENSSPADELTGQGHGHGHGEAEEQDGTGGANTIPVVRGEDGELAFDWSEVSRVSAQDAPGAV